MSGNIVTVFGDNFSWEIKNVLVEALGTPNIKITLDRSQKIDITIEGLSGKFHGVIGIKKNSKSLFNERIDGAICMDGYAAVTEDNFVVKIPECRCTTSCGGLQLHLGMSSMIPMFVQRLIDAAVAGVIEECLSSMVCGYLRDLDVSTYLNKSMVGIPLNDYFYIKWPSMKNFEIRNRGVVGYALGIVVPRDQHLDVFGDNGMVGSTLPYIGPYIDPNKSVQGMMSNYTISTFIYTAVKLGFLNKWIYANALSPDERTFLATSCKYVCFGTQFPSLNSKFPGRFVDVLTVVLANLTSYITEDYICINTTLTARCVVGNYTFLYLSADVSTSFTPFIENTTLSAKGKIIRFEIENIKVISSRIGDIPIDFQKWIFDVLRKIYLYKRLNAIVTKGIDLRNLEYKRNGHTHESYEIRDYDFKLNKNFALISGNLFLV